MLLLAGDPQVLQAVRTCGGDHTGSTAAVLPGVMYCQVHWCTALHITLACDVRYVALAAGTVLHASSDGLLDASTAVVVRLCAPGLDIWRLIAFVPNMPLKCFHAACKQPLIASSQLASSDRRLPMCRQVAWNGLPPMCDCTRAGGDTGHFS